MEEEAWFRYLIKVAGIGGRIAQNILFHFPPSYLAEIILYEKVDILKKMDGVGPKLAQRMIHELKSYAKNWHEKILPSERSGVFLETLSALQALGYGTQESETVIKNACLSLEPKTEIWVKAALEWFFQKSYQS